MISLLQSHTVRWWESQDSNPGLFHSTPTINHDPLLGKLRSQSLSFLKETESGQLRCQRKSTGLAVRRLLPPDSLGSIISMFV